MSEFYDAIYRITAKIPAGKVATYGQIALLAGRPQAPRQVGQAMRYAPQEKRLPCHRVVNRSGGLAPMEKDRHRMLLEGEGVTFLADGRVDLKKYQWDGSGLDLADVQVDGK